MRKKSRIWCIMLSLAVLVSAMSGCKREETAELFSMDTLVRFTLYGRNAGAARKACTEELYALEARFSVTDAGSDASGINRANGGQTAVSADTLSLLDTARTVFEETGGAFDVTVYPLVEAWGFSGGTNRVPDAEEIAALLPYVGMEKLTLGAGGVAAPAETRVDFGGIAKGFASARLAQTARECGVTSALFTLGGNVQALGSRPDGSAWRVAVMDPRNTEGTVGVISVTDAAVITAGGYQRYFVEDGKTYHHILDPHTGYPADSDLLSATVVSGDGARADALSTALFVLGREKAAALYRSAHGGPGAFEFVLVAQDGRIFVSEGLIFHAEQGLTVEIVRP